jgi:hypothetical protein
VEVHFPVTQRLLWRLLKLIAPAFSSCLYVCLQGLLTENLCSLKPRVCTLLPSLDFLACPRVRHVFLHTATRDCTASVCSPSAAVHLQLMLLRSEMPVVANACVTVLHVMHHTVPYAGYAAGGPLCIFSAVGNDAGCDYSGSEHEIL